MNIAVVAGALAATTLVGCMPDFPKYEVRASFRDDDFDGDGFTELEGDCDDEDAEIYPGAIELCDDADADEDCDGLMDDDDNPVAGQRTFYADADGDGHGDDGRPVSACDIAEGLAEAGDDCDDEDPVVGGQTTYWGDADGDGFGGTIDSQSCYDQTQFGYVLNSEDCNDEDAAINPETRWYADADADTYGDPFSTADGCEPGAGWVLDDSDCDDESLEIGPSCAWRDLSMADYFACGVRGNGKADCWGELYEGTLNPPDDVPFLDVDVADRPESFGNYRVVCGIREEDLGLTCWGADGVMLTDVPTGAYKAISVGVQHACALTVDGFISCWGADAVGQVSDAPSGGGFIDVIVGENLSLAVDADGAIQVWGNGASFPNLDAGDDTTLPEACRETAVSLYSASCDVALIEEQLGGDIYVSVGLDTTRVCGLTVDGRVRCAGAASDLERGGHDALEGVNVDSLAVGRYRTCGLEAGTGAITCGGSSSSVAPDLAMPGGYVQFAASLVGITDCARWEDDADGNYEIHCWGANDKGEGEPPS